MGENANKIIWRANQVWDQPQIDIHFHLKIQVDDNFIATTDQRNPIRAITYF